MHLKRHFDRDEFKCDNFFEMKNGEKCTDSFKNLPNLYQHIRTHLEKLQLIKLKKEPKFHKGAYQTKMKRCLKCDIKIDNTENDILEHLEQKHGSIQNFRCQSYFWKDCTFESDQWDLIKNHISIQHCMDKKEENSVVSK